MKKTITLLILFTIFFILKPLQVNADEWITEIAKKVKKSVVGIETVVKYKSGKKSTFGGTGFVIDKEEGLIFTVNHIARDDEDTKTEKDMENESEYISPQSKYYIYWIIFEGKKYPAKLLGSDKYHDIALLKLEKIPVGLTPMTLGDSDKLEVGNNVIAFGNPFDLENSVTKGIVSALHRKYQVSLWLVEDFIQTDAAINPGNSGSPLINQKGEVIGINDARVSNANNLGFAIPINFAVKNLGTLKKGDIKMGWFGAKVPSENYKFTGGFEDLKILNEILSVDNVKILNKINEILENKGGALVELVEKESPAEEAGLEKSDIIINFNNKIISDSYDLKVAILESSLNKELPLEVIRIDADGQTEKITKTVMLIDKIIFMKEKYNNHETHH